jgi:hypothetical protein
LNKLKGKPAVTRDGVTIGLYANIELPEDALAVQDVAADGVGLYRTEFLFMNRPDAPDEEEHLASYLHVIKTLEGMPVTIRTADLGADKQLGNGRGGHVATNPAHGFAGDPHVPEGYGDVSSATAGHPAGFGAWGGADDDPHAVFHPGSVPGVAVGGRNETGIARAGAGV